MRTPDWLVRLGQVDTVERDRLSRAVTFLGVCLLAAMLATAVYLLAWVPLRGYSYAAGYDDGRSDSLGIPECQWYVDRELPRLYREHVLLGPWLDGCVRAAQDRPERLWRDPLEPGAAGPQGPTGA